MQEGRNGERDVMEDMLKKCIAFYLEEERGKKGANQVVKLDDWENIGAINRNSLNRF